MWKCVKTQEGSRESTGGKFGLLGHLYSYCVTVSKFTHIVLYFCWRGADLVNYHSLWCCYAVCSSTIFRDQNKGSCPPHPHMLILRTFRENTPALNNKHLNNWARGRKVLWESGSPHMDRTSHAVWPQAKKEKSIFLYRPWRLWGLA